MKYAENSRNSQRDIAIPVLVFFIDGLMARSIEYMEFVNTLGHTAKIKSDLPTYSNTCYASMYTGVYPRKHKHFFIWKFSPETSPFKFLKPFRFVPPNHYIRFPLYVAAVKLKYGAYIPGFSSLARQPMKHWTYFAAEVVKYWGEPEKRIGDYPTIFKILEERGIDYHVIWKPKGPLGDISRISFRKPFTYIFIGHVDPITHRYGQDSPKSIALIKQIDKIIEKVYAAFEKKYGDFLFVAFSDHGLVRIEEKVSLHALFRGHGKDLNNYLHFIDGNYARFWIREEKEMDEILNVLEKLEDRGFVLTRDIQAKYNAEMPREYGDIIFYLDKPYAFDVVGDAKYMHGYLPDYEDLQGVLISNRPIIKGVAKLQDIAPSILEAFDIEVPKYMDGEPFWK